MPALDNILAVILGGGRGTRLYPLTKLRSKPAVPVAGKYRLIDIPISNCINSHIYRIAVLTQFNSVSLHRHIVQTYQFDVFHTGFVNIWAAEQTFTSTGWYQGTADAVRKQIFQIQSTQAEYVLILSGDHLYRMDYEEMAHFHWDNKADITVAVQPVLAGEASRLGLCKRDPSGRITRFAEKPKDPAILADMVSRPNDPIRPYVGSMGIYMFKTKTLIDLLEDNAFDDFGAQVIPHALSDYDIYGYNFEGYWADIGTIRSFYEINLALTQPNPPFDLYDPVHPIYSNSGFLPGSTIDDSIFEHVLISEGCIIRKSEIRNSIVGVRSTISCGVKLLNSIMMGADVYDQQIPGSRTEEDRVDIGIGQNCYIEGAIIDKNVRIGHDVVIKPFPRGTDLEADKWVVQDGIVVIPKNTLIPPKTVIAP